MNGFWFVAELFLAFAIFFGIIGLIARRIAKYWEEE